MNRIQAKVGQWFRDLASGQNFEVLMVYPKCGTIEVEYADGNLVELAVEQWEALNLVPASGPDDSGPLDLVDESAEDPEDQMTLAASPVKPGKPQNLGPQVGCWYRDLDTDRAFEVVKIYAACGSVEVEFSDGGMDEYAIEAWQRLRLTPCEDPDIAEEALEAEGKLPPEEESKPDEFSIPQAQQASLAHLLGTTTIH